MHGQFFPFQCWDISAISPHSTHTPGLMHMHNYHTSHLYLQNYTLATGAKNSYFIHKLRRHFDFIFAARIPFLHPFSLAMHISPHRILLMAFALCALQQAAHVNIRRMVYGVYLGGAARRTFNRIQISFASENICRLSQSGVCVWVCMRWYCFLAFFTRSVSTDLLALWALLGAGCCFIYTIDRDASQYVFVNKSVKYAFYVVLKRCGGIAIPKIDA